MFIENNKTNKQTKQARNGEKRKKEDKKRMIKKITSIFGPYRFLRIAWHDIFLLSDHFSASWNLYIPHDLSESEE